jgi:ferric-dicitrate binding protein FerR (iron transport regulator)
MTDITLLIHKFLKDELDEGEKLELQEWRAQSDVNNRIFEKLTNEDYLFTAVGDAYKIDSDEVAQQKMNVLIDQEQQSTAHLPEGNKITLRSIWPRLSVAAAILILLAVSAIYIVNRNRQPKAVVAETKKAKPDIAPGTYKATLQLADGSIVSLDSTTNKIIGQQGNTAIKNNNGQLVYNAKSSPSGGQGEAVLYNTVSTAKGQTYPVLLSDNSRVWLNSESSIRFPVAFVSGERKVEITGEVYFEVAHDASKPFIASVNGVDIQVLGTKFNINAYKDEDAIRTTLIEGAVRVSKGGQKKQIKPGQQAQVISNDIKVVDNVDLDKITAWKQGLFAFKGDKLQDVMKDLARWYNIDVVYEGSGTKDVEITGNIFRNWNLSEVLKILSTLNIESRIEGRTLILKAQ